MNELAADTVRNFAPVAWIRRAELLSVILVLAACGGTTSSKPDDQASAGSAGSPDASSAGGVMSQGGMRLPDGGKPQTT